MNAAAVPYLYSYNLQINIKRTKKKSGGKFSINPSKTIIQIPHTYLLITLNCRNHYQTSICLYELRSVSRLFSGRSWKKYIYIFFNGEIAPRKLRFLPLHCPDWSAVSGTGRQTFRLVLNHPNLI